MNDNNNNNNNNSSNNNDDNNGDVDNDDRFALRKTGSKKKSRFVFEKIYSCLFN